MANRVTRKLVRKALLSAPVQSRLSRCVSRDGGLGGAAGPAPRGAPAILELELETAAGELWIVEARVQAWGGASEQAVSCASDVLRGRLVAAAPAAPGQRARLPFPLNPRSGDMAVAR